MKFALTQIKGLGLKRKNGDKKNYLLKVTKKNPQTYTPLLNGLTDQAAIF